MQLLTSLSSSTPQRRSKWDKRTPVQYEQAVPAGPQLNPMVFFTIFCSFRLLPAQVNVHNTVVCISGEAQERTQTKVRLVQHATKMARLSETIDWQISKKALHARVAVPCSRKTCQIELQHPVSNSITSFCRMLQFWCLQCFMLNLC